MSVNLQTKFFQNKCFIGRGNQGLNSTQTHVKLYRI